ncbi:MAG: hypothetical protein WC895_04320 [Candidatus Shapirobacteria bacterium]|jgi:hypothetical protein
MKLGKSVLVEIIAIVQEGLLCGDDVSQRLRDIEVVVVEGVAGPEEVELTQGYIDSRKKE